MKKEVMKTLETTKKMPKELFEFLRDLDTEPSFELWEYLDENRDCRQEMKDVITEFDVSMPKECAR